MGLKDIRLKVIEKLQEGRVQHETSRGGCIDERNLLFVGKVSIDKVIELIRATKGQGYSKTKHHIDKNIDVHVFKINKDKRSWYIKCYLIEPDLWFISVHH